MSRWLLVGSSPSAVAGMQWCKAHHSGADRTITTNGGIALVKCPTFYLLHDPRAAVLFRPQWQRAQKCRTVIVKSVLHNSAQHRAALSGVAADITITTFAASRPRYERNRSISPACSGAIAAQFAVHNGCSHLVMVGMDGYRSTHGRVHIETFDGRRGHALQHSRTMSRYGPLMASMCRCRRDVQFTWVGAPIYSALLHGCSNVRIVPVSTGGRHDCQSKAPATLRLR
jgi:hypothetical protein